ncbi:hypothetical protein CN425_19965 [Bacillus cereus]|nr:hypothetical protein CON38_01550 [Bacillus cereus]PEV98746.1 hypothetical protein CN425_19965 [Bacillus cereus]PFI16461.1 hypothetical protein COI75_22210 [Bacillus cereus]
MLNRNSLVETLTGLQPVYYLFEYSPLYANLYSNTYTVFYASDTCEIDYVVIPMYPSSLDTLYLLSISLHN